MKKLEIMEDEETKENQNAAWQIEAKPKEQKIQDNILNVWKYTSKNKLKTIQQ